MRRGERGKLAEDNGRLGSRGTERVAEAWDAAWYGAGASWRRKVASWDLLSCPDVDEDGGLLCVSVAWLSHAFSTALLRRRREGAEGGVLG